MKNHAACASMLGFGCGLFTLAAIVDADLLAAGFAVLFAATTTLFWFSEETHG